MTRKQVSQELNGLREAKPHSTFIEVQDVSENIYVGLYIDLDDRNLEIWGIKMERLDLKSIKRVRRMSEIDVNNLIHKLLYKVHAASKELSTDII